MEITIQQVDITTLQVDAIVNAANSSLMGGGGVDGAIHRAAGPKLLEACRELRRTTYPHGLPVGEAVATPGFDLPAKWVIHTVGPNRRAGQTDPQLLRNAFLNSLDQAEHLGAKSIAFPAISGGIYGWDMEEVAKIGIESVLRFDADSGSSPRSLQRVVFALFSEDAERLFREMLERLK